MIRSILFALVFFFVSQPAMAKIYKWVDKDGKMHFTDDIKKIPFKDRAGSKDLTPGRNEPRYDEPASIHDTEPSAAPVKRIRKTPQYTFKPSLSGSKKRDDPRIGQNENKESLFDSLFPIPYS